MGSDLNLKSFFTLIDPKNTQYMDPLPHCLQTTQVVDACDDQDRFNKYCGDVSSVGSWRSSRASLTGLSCRYAISLFGAVMR